MIFPSYWKKELQLENFSEAGFGLWKTKIKLEERRT
jgi:hypothetical protein